MTGYDSMPTVVSRATADISAHLWSLYWLARTLPVRTAVELGVRSGDSTRALLAACEDVGGMLFSFDAAGDAYRVKEVTESYGIPHFVVQSSTAAVGICRSMPPMAPPTASPSS